MTRARSVPSAATVSKGRILKHYDNAAGEHYVDRPITFTAPSDLQGRNSVSNTLQVQSHGKTVSVTITISQPKETQNDGPSVNVSQPVNTLNVSFHQVVTDDTTRTDSTVAFTAHLSYYTTDMPTLAKSPTFDFGQCQFPGEDDCAIVTGENVDQLPFLSGTLLPINVATNHEDIYQQDTLSGQWQLTSSTDTPFVSTCEEVGLHIAVEPGSTAASYQYRVVLDQGNLYCSQGQPVLPRSISLSMDGGNDQACETPPRIQPADIEPWVENPQGPKTWTLNGSVNCQDANTTTTEDATVTITLIPCNGAPCVQ